MNQEQIARVAHEVNRAYCQALGDNSQPKWEDAPQWQRDSAMLGVQLHTENPNAGPQASHESWMAQMVAYGWVYGPEKWPEAKEHHCIVAFDQLPREQQTKDYIFRGVVHALAHAPTALENDRDATRYRWLRTVAAESLAAIAWRSKAACEHSDADEAIDAAMQDETPNV